MAQSAATQWASVHKSSLGGCGLCLKAIRILLQEAAVGFGQGWRLEPCHHSTLAVRLEKGVFISVLNVEVQGGCGVLVVMVQVFRSSGVY